MLQLPEPYNLILHYLVCLSKFFLQFELLDFDDVPRSSLLSTPRTMPGCQPWSILIWIQLRVQISSTAEVFLPTTACVQQPRCLQCPFRCTSSSWPLRCSSQTRTEGGATLGWIYKHIYRCDYYHPSVWLYTHWNQFTISFPTMTMKYNIPHWASTPISTWCAAAVPDEDPQPMMSPPGCWRSRLRSRPSSSSSPVWGLESGFWGNHDCLRTVRARRRCCISPSRRVLESGIWGCQQCQDQVLQERCPPTKHQAPERLTGGVWGCGIKPFLFYNYKLSTNYKSSIHIIQIYGVKCS